MESEKKNNKLRQYLDHKCMDIKEFSRISGIKYNTAYKIARGSNPPTRKTANMIARACNGEVTIKDFGYE